jgi:integration host factor subunit beta
MLKSDLYTSLNKKYTSLSTQDIELVSDLFFKKIIKSLKDGNKIEIRGFGTLSKKLNKAKYVRNPKTNEKIYKKETFKIHFKIGKILHNKINIKIGNE